MTHTRPPSLLPAAPGAARALLIFTALWGSTAHANDEPPAEAAPAAPAPPAPPAPEAAPFAPPDAAAPAEAPTEVVPAVDAPAPAPASPVAAPAPAAPAAPPPAVAAPTARSSPWDSPLVWGGAAAAGVGVAVGLVGGTVALVQVGEAGKAFATFDEVESAKATGRVGVFSAVGGAAVSVIGAAVAVVGFSLGSDDQ